MIIKKKGKQNRKKERIEKRYVPWNEGRKQGTVKLKNNNYSSKEPDNLIMYDLCNNCYYKSVLSCLHNTHTVCASLSKA